MLVFLRDEAQCPAKWGSNNGMLRVLGTRFTRASH